MSAPTSDDLRERVRAGDLEALLDPALPLHLLADGPMVDWWVQGSRSALLSLLHAFVGQLDLALLADEVDAWGVREGASRLPRWNDRLHMLRATRPQDRFGSLYATIRLARHQVPHLPSAMVRLARSLRALLPSAPPEVDAALVVLERYAG